jgi:hypothetical protein
MSDNFSRVLRDVFVVQLSHPPNVELKLIPGGQLPVRLVLSLEGRPDLERALATPSLGTILEVGMKWGVAIEIYQQIADIARTMGWPLSRLDEGRS